MTTHVMFSVDNLPDDVIFVPMLDARRMEVYTAAYDFSLLPLISPTPLVLDAEKQPYNDLLATGRPILFFGNGMPKWRESLDVEKPVNALFIDDVEPLAVDMTALSERAYAKREFLDTAYSTPVYLKDFQATKPKNRVLSF